MVTNSRFRKMGVNSEEKVSNLTFFFRKIQIFFLQKK